MQITFLCGCQSGNVEFRDNLATMNSIIVDDEGMLICQVHRQRRLGWRSLPGGVERWGKFESFTPAQIEGFVLFDEPLPHLVLAGETELVFPKDIRDIRDPEKIGTALLEKKKTARVCTCSNHIQGTAHSPLCPFFID